MTPIWDQPLHDAACRPERCSEAWLVGGLRDPLRKKRRDRVVLKQPVRGNASFLLNESLSRAGGVGQPAVSVYLPSCMSVRLSEGRTPGPRGSQAFRWTKTGVHTTGHAPTPACSINVGFHQQLQKCGGDRNQTSSQL